MIKILQITNKAPYPADDGSSIAIYNMAGGFLRNDTELFLLSINTRKHFKPDNEVPEDFRKGSHYESVYRNTNTSATGALANLLFSGKSYFVSRFYFTEFSEKLSTLLQQHRFDIVQIEGLFMAVYMPIIRRMSRAKIVLRTHNVEHLIWDRHIAGMAASPRKFYLQLQNRRLKRFELQCYSRADAIVAISSVDESFIKVMCPAAKVYTCITGVDVQAYRQKQKKGRPGTLFYFGSMDWLPNQEAARWFLQNCWRRILAKVPEAKFVIAGRGMPLDFFHIVEPNVQIIEKVEDSSDFFTSHDIMVVPLLSGSGLRIKIVEGMAYGKAIVSTSIGAEGIAAVNGREIIIADDPDTFADAVIGLLKDTERCARMSEAAGQFALEHFDNASVVGRLLGFYNSLLND